MRVAPKIELTDEERAALTKLWRSGLTSVRLAQRARIILLADQGLNNKDIAAQLGIGRMQPARWRERYLQGGIKAIERDLPRGAPPVKVDVAQLVQLTTQSSPEAITHWSTRKMGTLLGVSASRMDSRRSALRSPFRSGRRVTIWLRMARSASVSEKSAAVAGAWWVSQSSSTLSARVMVGQIGQSVSSRSMEMARMREVSREGFGTGRT